ncbi:MAG: 6-bladed beta-propeller [Balneolaceae bacterium]
MKYTVVLFSAFLFNCSGSIERVKNSSELEINPANVSATKYSSFVKNVEFIKLDSAKYFGSIEKLLVTKDRLFILDSYNSLALYVYNRKGELLFDISNYGRGPGEFMGPYDFAIDKKSEEIIIYDARGSKFSYFNLDDGSFIEDKILKFRFRRFEVFNDGYIFYLDNRKDPNVVNNIIVTDQNFIEIHSFSPIIDGLRGYHAALPTNFTSYGNDLNITIHSENSIYKVTDENKVSKMSIDFGKYNLPQEFFEFYETNQDRRASREGKAFNITAFFETDSFTHFLYWVNTDSYHYFKSRKSDETIHTRNDKLIDDLGIGPLIRWPNTVYENSLVWYQQPTELFDYLAEKKEQLNDREWDAFSKKNKKLISFSETLSKNDNPYLIFMEIDF